MKCDAAGNEARLACYAPAFGEGSIGPSGCPSITAGTSAAYIVSNLPCASTFLAG